MFPLPCSPVRLHTGRTVISTAGQVGGVALGSSGMLQVPFIALYAPAAYNL